MSNQVIKRLFDRRKGGINKKCYKLQKRVPGIKISLQRGNPVNYLPSDFQTIRELQDMGGLMCGEEDSTAAQPAMAEPQAQPASFQNIPFDGYIESMQNPVFSDAIFVPAMSNFPVDPFHKDDNAEEDDQALEQEAELDEDDSEDSEDDEDYVHLTAIKEEKDPNEGLSSIHSIPEQMNNRPQKRRRHLQSSDYPDLSSPQNMSSPQGTSSPRRIATPRMVATPQRGSPPASESFRASSPRPVNRVMRTGTQQRSISYSPSRMQAKAALPIRSRNEGLQNVTSFESIQQAPLNSNFSRKPRGRQF
ncbi:hypothetical protein AOQ84DRAFT_420654 [Glonium stellatum]|uniref:Uncharacterized protein n=1 Tax=Glonium stellatum TaxID=574774 RepID=A0A8E2EQX6_9PEZI|nr:hypothetical protein AOQ84DRAFT_420654 [Glonium stellatum]